MAAPPVADRPFPMSRCHACAHVRYNGNTRGSIFLQCTEGTLPKYAPQPVRLCPRFTPANP
jgi:uncharacterized protein YbbK (DUF523 family)